jgi:hypothetical protein
MVKIDEAALVREAVRVYRRYAMEIVEGLGFCPYAERARAEGHTKEIVLTDPIPTDADVEFAIQRIAADDNIEIGLVIFPRLTISRPKLGRWVEHLRKRHARDRPAILAIEGFHPDAEPDASSAERLTPFVRRTPDPTLQLTRLSVLERVRRGTSQGTAFVDPMSIDLASFLASTARAPLHERIAEKNLETCERLGVDAVAARMDDILRDRDASYTRIDPSIPPRG